MRCTALVSCILVLGLSIPRQAHADDWLVSLDACAIDAPSRPELALVYPRPGLPALVPAGERIVARVRVPAALTPPPGVQQEKVLWAWGGELSGRRLALGDGATASLATHGYTLSAVNLRPDAAGSLVYRISLAVPAYAAPGTYDLRVRTPFGALVVPGVVRVLAAGQAPRVASVLDPAGAPLAWQALDSVVMPLMAADARASAAASSVIEQLAPPPALLLPLRGVALRLGSHGLAAAGCADAEAAAAAFSPLSARGPAQLRIAARPRLLEVHNASTQPAELPLLLSPGFSARVQGGTLSFFPANDARSQRPPSVAARLVVPAAAHAKVELARAPRPERYRLEPHAAVAGRAIALRVVGAPSDARVAFDLGPLRTAFSGPVHEVVFAEPGGHHPSALVLERDGSAHVARGQLWVSAERPRASCAAAPAGPRGLSSPALGCQLLLFVAACLLKRRARARFGNRVRG